MFMLTLSDKEVSDLRLRIAPGGGDTPPTEQAFLDSHWI